MNQEIQKFFDALTEPADTIEIRLLPPMKTKANQLFWYPGMIDHEWEFIQDRNRKQDVYFGVNPRQEHRGTADAVTICRVVFADFDHMTPDAAMEKIEAAKLPQPTVLTNSGHGAHAYWRLEDEIDTLQWRAIQRGLIDILGCDEKVKDAPRIMRMPKTRHVAKHVRGTEPTYCSIIFNTMVKHDIEDIVRCLPAEPVVDHTPAEPLPEGECARLPAWANAFLVGGTGEGDRNSKAFDVACAMAGNGWPEEKAREKIVAAAEQCVPPLSQGEALSAVKSAYSKQRTPPKVDLSHLPNHTAWQIALPTPEPMAEEPVAEDDADSILYGDPVAMSKGRPAFSNVIESTDKEGETITHAKHVDDITASLHEITGQWPRRAGGMLFVPGDQPRPGELPEPTAVRTITKPDELFAWVHGRSSLYWADNRRCTDTLDGGSRSSVKKSEFFEHLRETVKPSYGAAEILPHHPPADRVWYAPCVLPKADRGILDEFVGKLNWATEMDKSLMMAACLTLFWGGPCGARPAFVITSEHGAGAGKTTTADMICELAGGRMEYGANEKPDAFAKRLLSDEGMRSRAVLMDNVKRRVDAQGIEAMITGKEIGGHRMYAGHATKPNRMTWFITANSPRLSHDLAERAYNIRIGSQRTDGAWMIETAEWVKRNRPALISACLSVLQGPAICEIDVRDRWAAWQNDVLSRVPLGQDIAKVMAERRNAMDADRDDAEEIAMVVRGLLRYYGYADAESVYVFFTRRALADAYNIWVNEGDHRTRRQTVSLIGNRVGNGALKQLKEVKCNGERGYAWSGKEVAGLKTEYDRKLTDIPASLQASDMQPMEGLEDE